MQRARPLRDDNYGAARDRRARRKGAMTQVVTTTPWPPHKREEYIRELRNPVGKETIEFQGQLQTLDVFLVPLEMPIYRLENGRTIDRQEEYVATVSLWTFSLAMSSHGKHSQRRTKSYKAWLMKRVC